MIARDIVERSRAVRQRKGRDPVRPALTTVDEMLASFQMFLLMNEPDLLPLVAETEGAPDVPPSEEDKDQLCLWLVRFMDGRHIETARHMRRAALLMGLHAGMIGLAPDAIVAARRQACLVHDLGKALIDPAILDKKGKLDESDWAKLKAHPVYSRDILSRIPCLAGDAQGVPYTHHEKWDGSGYPRGLRGEEIPVTGRLFALIDVWEALTAGRHYQEGGGPWPRDRVIGLICDGKGSHFDPNLVDPFLRAMDWIHKLGAGDQSGASGSCT